MRRCSRAPQEPSACRQQFPQLIAVAAWCVACTTLLPLAPRATVRRESSDTPALRSAETAWRAAESEQRGSDASREEGVSKCASSASVSVCSSCLCILVVMSPERANLILTADVPDGERNVLVLHRLHVEANCRDGGHHLHTNEERGKMSKQWNSNTREACSRGCCCSFECEAEWRPTSPSLSL